MEVTIQVTNDAITCHGEGTHNPQESHLVWAVFVQVHATDVRQIETALKVACRLQPAVFAVGLHGPCVDDAVLATVAPLAQELICTSCVLPNLAQLCFPRLEKCFLSGCATASKQPLQWHCPALRRLAIQESELALVADLLCPFLDKVWFLHMALGGEDLAAIAARASEVDCQNCTGVLGGPSTRWHQLTTLCVHKHGGPAFPLAGFAPCLTLLQVEHCASLRSLGTIVDGLVDVRTHVGPPRIVLVACPLVCPVQVVDTMPEGLAPALASPRQVSDFPQLAFSDSQLAEFFAYL